MKHRPKVPSYDALLAEIILATSATTLAPMLQAATTCFCANQRDALEVAVEQRRGELLDGEDFGG